MVSDLVQDWELRQHTSVSVCVQITIIIIFMGRYSYIFKTQDITQRLQTAASLHSAEVWLILHRYTNSLNRSKTSTTGISNSLHRLDFILQLPLALSQVIERPGIPMDSINVGSHCTVALHDLAAKFLQAALFDCLMPRLNFGVSAEVRLSCSCQENTEQLYDSIVHVFHFKSVLLTSFLHLVVLLLGPGPWLKTAARLCHYVVFQQPGPWNCKCQSKRFEEHCKESPDHRLVTVQLLNGSQRISKDLKGNKKA